MIKKPVVSPNVVETCTHSLEIILNKKKVGEIGEKGESKDGDTAQMEIWKARTPQGLAWRKQDLFLLSHKHNT